MFVIRLQCAGFWERVHAQSGDRIRLNMPLMMEGLFGGAAVMITLGAVLGRTSPAQLVMVVLLEASASAVLVLTPIILSHDRTLADVAVGLTDYGVLVQPLPGHARERRA